MENPKDGTFTIRRAEGGRSIALWWEEIPAPSDPFETEFCHFATKALYFEQPVVAAKLEDHILNHGVRGLKVTIADGQVVKVSDV